MNDLKLYGGSPPDIESLIQTVYTVTDDIGMRFGINKCGNLAMRTGKESKCEGIAIESGEVICKIVHDGYKYLCIIEKSDVFQEQMKRSVKTEYFKRVRSDLKSKLNSGNVFQAINICVVTAV